MAAEIIKIDPAHPERMFSRCGDVIRAGGVIVYPTDTFYGLGVDPKNTDAVAKIFRIKGRQAGQPILLLIKDASEVLIWAQDVTAQSEALMEKFWPGPLTLVFKAKPGVIQDLTGATGTIGLRVPGNALTRRLLEALGGALTGTSANLSGGPNVRTAVEATASLGNRVDLILDGGTTAGGMPSTVVDASEDNPRVIREGLIPAREILGAKYSA